MNSCCNLNLFVCLLLSVMIAGYALCHWLIQAHCWSGTILPVYIVVYIVYNSSIIMNYVHAIITGTDFTCSYHVGDLLIKSYNLEYMYVAENFSY